jgi:azurin
MNTKRLLTHAVAAAIALSTLTARAQDDAAAPADAAAPRISLDKSPAIVAFQLKRLTNKQLIDLERKPDEAKYKPVYLVLLTRKGLEKKYREEAVDALTKIGKADAASVLLDGIGKLGPDDKGTTRELVGLLMAQKPEALKAQREKLESLAKESDKPMVKQAAYAALATADGKGDAAWQLASGNNDAAAMLGGIPLITAPAVRASFYPQVKPLVEKAPDDATRVAAVEAVSAIPGKEAEAFGLLADIVQKESGDVQAAAIRSIGRIPASKWPKDRLEPLATTIVKLVEKTPADQRTSPEMIQTVQLGNDLGAAVGGEKGAAVRRSLRELAVRVVLIHTLYEQMMYDLRYFTVQAGKPVQVILQNSDTMPHNIVITAPGAMQEIALTAGAMQANDDPAVKQFVPDSPKVLQSTKLVQPDESAKLSFTAPPKPGNYPFLCTYPGHWVKMYGVMQVVPDLDQYDQKPTPPKDPLTHKPYGSAKNESTISAEGHEAHQH